jgi:acyl-CoA hydrolase
MLIDTVSTHLVKGSDLNHHGTLFAGRMAEWFVETSFLAGVRFLGNPENLVCVKIHGLAFTQPARPGDVVEIVAAVAKAGTKSITVGAEVFVNGAAAPAVRGFATFVSVDASGAPYPHGLGLPPEWVAAHRVLCEDAAKLPAR